MSSSPSGDDGQKQPGLITSLLAACDSTGKDLDPNSSCGSTEMPPNEPSQTDPTAPSVDPAVEPVSQATIVAKASYTHQFLLYEQPRPPPPPGQVNPPTPPPPPGGSGSGSAQPLTPPAKPKPSCSSDAVDDNQQAADEADDEPQAKRAKTSSATATMTLTERVVASGDGLGGPGGTSIFHSIVTQALQIGVVQYERQVQDAQDAEQAERNLHRRKQSRHRPIDVPANEMEIYEGEQAMNCSPDELPVTLCKCCGGASCVPPGPEHLTYFHGHYLCCVCLVLFEIVALVKRGRVRSWDELVELLEVLQAVKLALTSPSGAGASNVAG